MIGREQPDEKQKEHLHLHSGEENQPANECVIAPGNQATGELRKKESFSDRMAKWGSPDEEIQAYLPGPEFTRAVETAQNSFFFVVVGIIALMIGLALVSICAIYKQAGGVNIDMSSNLLGLSFRNAGNLNQVLVWLPVVVVSCVGMTVAASWVSRESRSREIDWTDTHLILEHSGPIALAIKWTAIKSVRQTQQWDVFHGRQPVFLLEIHDGDVFRLKLSDIALKHNVGAFFSMIKTNAPEAELAVAPDFASDNAYTELWLKYFSTPTQRDRASLLEKDMVVDDGRYKIVGTIGGGGQGTAYLAQVIDRPWTVSRPQVKDDQAETASTGSRHIIAPDQHGLSRLQEVVLKEYILPVHRGQLTAERTAEKLRSEAEILKKLDHPQIVKLLDAFIEDYRGYLVLEYVYGESLKAMVDRMGPPPEQYAAINWAMQTCRILDYLHNLEPPIVHRDITPDNLLLQEDGMIKLVDFNVAYQVDSSSTATVVGKHAYIPAEQFRGKPVVQSDIYSLGGTMHFLLTGEEPEPITQSHPREVNPSISAALDDIVAKATSSEASARYASAAEMEQALKAIAAPLIRP